MSVNKGHILKTLRQIETSAIVERIIVCGGNLTHTAKSLEISRAALYNKIKRYGVKLDAIRQDLT